jgi:magnesium transporter
MAIELTDELFEEVIAYVREEDRSKAQPLIQEMYPADIAYLIEYLPRDQALFIFNLLNRETAVEVLSELQEESRSILLALFTPQQIVNRFIGEMDTDDAADLINEFPEPVRRQLIDAIYRSRSEDIQEVVSLLAYEEDQAGALMAKELVRINIDATVSECIDEVRAQNEDVESIYAVYVVDDQDRLVGLAPLQRLIVARPQRLLREILEEDVVSVTAKTPAEEAAQKMERYNLVALPVVDDQGVLIGRITIDDVVDYIREEADQDYQLASGISEDVAYNDAVWVLSRARLPWLLLGLLGGVISSRVIGLYEADLETYPQLAFFIPLVAAMGGNAGVQSSAIVVQSLANDTFRHGRLLQKLGKELMVALINGLLCSLVLLAYGLVAMASLPLSLTVGIALLTVIVLASLLGVSIPLLLNYFNIDPALATGPFITTTNDLIGLAVYFLVGRAVFDWMQ